MTEYFDELTQELVDGSDRVRRAAAQALGQLGDARAVYRLIAALGDEYEDVREAAAEALGMLGSARAVDSLVAALVDRDSSVRKAAATALDQLCWAPKEDRTGAVYWVAKQDWAHCVALGTLALGPLIAVLRDKRSSVRKGAARALGELGDVRAVIPLITASQDKHWLVLRTAVEALIQIGPPAVQQLISALRSEDRWGRAAAAEALGKSGDVDAVDSLTAALTDEACLVRKAAAEALGNLGDARATEPLVVILGDSNWQVREAAALALDKLRWKPQTDEERIAYWIAKRDWKQCTAAGEPAVESLVNLINSDTCSLPATEHYSVCEVLSKCFGSHPSVIGVLKKPTTRSILIVDDERDIRELIGFSLRFAGYRCVLAEDGLEAIKRTVEEMFDLILLDVRMPYMTGYEVCRILKEMDATRGIPVAFLSAKGQEGEVRQGLEVGAVEYWVKPFAPDQLTGQIKDILRRCDLGIYGED